MTTVLQGPRGMSGNEVGRPGRWLGLRVLRARTHTCLQRATGERPHSQGAGAAPRPCEPNLEPRDPAPPPQPASQPRRPRNQRCGSQAKDSFLMEPTRSRPRFSSELVQHSRAPACRNTPACLHVAAIGSCSYSLPLAPHIHTENSPGGPVLCVVSSTASNVKLQTLKRPN